MSVEQITPYGTGERKREQIARAFDVLARRYDAMNRLLSLGLDTGWRRRALRRLAPLAPARLLDVATGTADFAILAARLLPATRVTGVDVSQEMLAIGRQKVARAALSQRVELLPGDGLALAFPDDCFDAATAAFGVRNYEDLAAGFRELRRVLKPGSPVVIVELSRPRARLLRAAHGWYLRRWIPLLGKWLAGRAQEYAYLPDSIAEVPQGEAMLALLREAGFRDCAQETYTFGICSCYTGRA